MTLYYDAVDMVYGEFLWKKWKWSECKWNSVMAVLGLMYAEVDCRIGWFRARVQRRVPKSWRNWRRWNKNWQCWKHLVILSGHVKEPCTKLVCQHQQFGHNVKIIHSLTAANVHNFCRVLGIGVWKFVIILGDRQSLGTSESVRSHTDLYFVWPAFIFGVS